MKRSIIYLLVALISLVGTLFSSYFAFITILFCVAYMFQGIREKEGGE